MNHYAKIALVLCACLALTTAQFGHYGFSDFATSFGGPTYSNFASAARDPRANTGPVLFPPSPSGGPGQTSGVVVGASGYGFVPPGSQALLPTAGYSHLFITPLITMFWRVSSIAS